MPWTKPEKVFREAKKEKKRRKKQRERRRRRNKFSMFTDDSDDFIEVSSKILLLFQCRKHSRLENPGSKEEGLDDTTENLFNACDYLKCQ